MATPASEIGTRGTSSAVDATITIASGAGGCSQIAVSPDSFEKSRNGAAIWQVDNNCGATVTVTIDNWMLDGQPKSPMTGKRSVDVPAGENRPLPLMVRGDATTGTYKYSVYVAVDGQNKGELDPQVIVKN